MNIPTSHWWDFSWHGLGVGKSSITLTLSFYIDSALGVESSLHKTAFFHVLPPAPDALTRECLEGAKAGAIVDFSPWARSQRAIANSIQCLLLAGPPLSDDQITRVVSKGKTELFFNFKSQPLHGRRISPGRVPAQASTDPLA